LQIGGNSDDEIAKKLQSKLPAYLKIHENGKLLAKGSMSKFAKASTFSSLVLPDLSESIIEVLNEKGLDKYINPPKKSPIK